MTLLKGHLGTDFGDVQFGVQMSCRYHAARQKHYEFCSKMTSFLIIVFAAGSGFIFVEQGAGLHRFILPGIVVLISILDLIFKPSRMAAIHRMLASQFTRLDMKMTTSEEKDASKAEYFQALTLEIETEEPPILKVPSVVSYNELCEALGSNQEIRYIGRFKRLFAQWIWWPQKEWVLLKDHKKKERRSPRNDLQVST